MKRVTFHVFVTVLLIAFAVVSVSGCGGNSGGGSSSTGGVYARNAVLYDGNYDSDGDGTPDVFDFDDVTETYYGLNEIIQSRSITVPSRNYLAKYKTASESADSFVVALTAGTEYTVEISGGTSYDAPIGDSVPDVEIVNPQGNALKFLNLGTFDASYDVNTVITLSPDVIQLSVYPADNPYMVCYTFTPATTGSYTIYLSRSDLSQLLSEDILFDDPAITLFIYEELRRNDEDGEPGYYRRYHFQDEAGNTSETISISDIMELRKAVINAAIEKVWEYVISGDETLTENDLVAKVVASATQAYSDCLNRLKAYYGILDTVSSDQEVIRVRGVVDSADEDEDEGTTASLSEFYSAAASNADGTQIAPELFGIPYTTEFKAGSGYFAVTGAKSISDGVKKFTLEAPAKKKVKARYLAQFVSSQEDREKLSTTAVEGGLEIGGFGLKAGYSSSSSFKFGLTSTTFVIHYEEVETAYRELDEDEYKLKDRALRKLNQDLTTFRNEYGDYFVAGYKYGGTYDAFITITTKTMEQLDTVKSGFGVKFESEGKAASADIGNETKELLRQNNATVNIEIRTAGLDDNGPIATTTKDIGQIATSLQEFRRRLKQSSPEDYQPVYVMLKRYRALDSVADKMDAKNDNGLIPIAPQHSRKIRGFNREYMIMTSYYNVIKDTDAMQMDTEVLNNYKRRYEAIADEVIANSSTFYAESNSRRMDELKTTIINFSKELKAVGDRYTFYQLLMSAQKKEESASTESNINYRPFGYNGGQVGLSSFAVSEAVTSDIAAGSEQHGFRNTFSGKSWEPIFTTDADHVFCYIKVIANNTHDVTRTADVPCVGTHRASFHFTCGVARWLEWDVTLKSMRFTRNLYPFSGLK